MPGWIWQCCIGPCFQTWMQSHGPSAAAWLSKCRLNFMTLFMLLKSFLHTLCLWFIESFITAVCKEQHNVPYHMCARTHVYIGTFPSYVLVNIQPFDIWTLLVSSGGNVGYTTHRSQYQKQRLCSWALFFSSMWFSVNIFLKILSCFSCLETI